MGTGTLCFEAHMLLIRYATFKCTISNRVPLSRTYLRGDGIQPIPKDVLRRHDLN